VTTVARTVLRDRVREILLERILRGEYRQGERLVETRIAQELGTSQAPVREALRELEQLRLVESEPYRGARVRAVATRELVEIYPVRAAIEEVAGRAAAVRLAGDVRVLARELDAMRAAAEEGDLREQAEHDVRFHRAIVEAAGNSILLDVWSSLRLESRTIITALAVDLDLRELAELHVPVLEALASGDPDRAGAELRRHVERFGELLIQTQPASEGGAA
jgi:DNA-binding GntR family transcriptional regulator